MATGDILNQPSAQNDVVWPPPPSGRAPVAAWFAFRFLNMRVEGQIADFRSGYVNLAAAGVTVYGRVVTESRGYLIVWPLIVMHDRIPRRIGLALLAAYVLCALLLRIFSKTATLTLAWDRVRQIVLDPDKDRACLVYDAPDRAGKIRTYSLAFALTAALYPTFAASAERFAPERIVNEKIRGESQAVPILILCNLLGVLFAALLLAWAFTGHF